MFSAAQLLEKIGAGESSTVEFKEVRIAGNTVKNPGRSDLADEIAAFANHQGGVIIFGVSDDKNILGIGDDPKLLIHFISEICHDSIKPSIMDYSVESVLVPDGTGQEKRLVYIDVKKSLWLHRSAGGYYLRQGDTKREMTPEQLARISQARSQARIIRFDEQFVPNTDKATLSRHLFARFIKESETGAETEQQETEQLLKRQLLADDNGVYRASVAGLLMCSDRSHEHLYNSFVCAVCYKGLHKDANYQLDAQDFKGPLDEQIMDSCKFVEKHNQKSARKEVGRWEQPQYSVRAIFEALVNAVVHRDYSIHGSKIRLFLFADRLELYSPGALANTMTVDTLAHKQATRNELLSRLLSELAVEERLGGTVRRRYFLERRGEGIGIILRESEELSGRKPVYRMYGEELCLTIFAAQSLQEQA